MNADRLGEHDALTEGLIRIEQMRLLLELIDREQKKQGAAARRRVDLAVDMASELAETFQLRMEKRRHELIQEVTV